MKLVTEGVPVYYLTGNHDEMLRKFADLDMGTFHLSNKLVLPVGKQKAWIFHGDIFDVTMQHSKWLAKLGAVGYDLLILINSFVNWALTLTGREKMSFSKRIKKKFKDAVKFINQFEDTAAGLAIEKGYDFVICGHIHQPEMRCITTEKGSVQYLNSGDWIENLTALEYHNEEWKIFRYQPEHFKENSVDENDQTEENLDAMLDVNKILEKLRGETV
jgi:UDP-2,3-diacylglucosamine pyrophosphatase LpxH